MGPLGNSSNRYISERKAAEIHLVPDVRENIAPPSGGGPRCDWVVVNQDWENRPAKCASGDEFGCTPRMSLCETESHQDHSRRVARNGLDLSDEQNPTAAESPVSQYWTQGLELVGERKAGPAGLSTRNYVVEPTRDGRPRCW